MRKKQARVPRGKGEPFLGTGRARGRVATVYRGVEMSDGPVRAEQAEHTELTRRRKK